MSPKIHKYAKKGQRGKLLRALKHCNDVDVVDENGKTALYYAVSEGHPQCIDVLMGHGADPERASSSTKVGSVATALSHSFLSLAWTNVEKSKSTISIDRVISLSKAFVPSISAKELGKFGNTQLACGGWMVYSDTYWSGLPVTIKYANASLQRERKDAQSIQRRLLENEACILRELHHPNVIKLIATCRNEFGPPTLLFDQVSHQNLALMMISLNSSSRTLALCSALYQIVLALQYIHNNSIVHNYVNARSVHCHEGLKFVLADFQHAQRMTDDLVPISSNVSQLPWMAPAQADGADPEPSSDIYSFGALTWELLARKPPLHWRQARSGLTEDAMFTFPVQSEWSLIFRNIISFCVLPFADTRPDHDVLLGMLRNEMTSIEKGRDVNTDGVADNEDEGRSTETDSCTQTALPIKLADIFFEDLVTLQRNLCACNLTLSKAQDILNIAKKHDRKNWAMQSFIAKELARIAYDRHLPQERKDMAKEMLKKFEHSLRMDDFASGTQCIVNTKQAEEARKGRIHDDLHRLKGLASQHQRKEWSKLTTQLRTSSIENKLVTNILTMD